MKITGDTYFGLEIIFFIIAYIIVFVDADKIGMWFGHMVNGFESVR